MSSRYTALIIPARISDPVRLETLEPGLRTLQDLVGEEIERVTRGDWHVYLYAEGVISNLPLNLRAAQLTYDCGLDLSGVARGTAVFLGHGGHGEEADVPDPPDPTRRRLLRHGASGLTGRGCKRGSRSSTLALRGDATQGVDVVQRFGTDVPHGRQGLPESGSGGRVTERASEFR